MVYIQTQLCQLRCLMTITRQLHVSAPTGHLQVTFRELKVLLYSWTLSSLEDNNKGIFVYYTSSLTQLYYLFY